ncbi:FtsW/RodA/SpoVE family cell cycle protein [Lacticaseibacillus absianus]|uniref:FtsW/RodA/SpoVE family cell cycle protein n=1 Tax=Lacticaseibacillus absianus TaxID=2729623 RepID=UPI0015CD73DE|nr:putative peptidoglycan glycosyltransferase FtsW [Lacticaseibacillus absianus]
MDYYILIPFLVLCATGVVMVYSASAYYVRVHFGDAETSVMIKQLLFVLLGVMLVAFFYYFKLSLLRSKWAQVGMWVLIFTGLLILVVQGKLDPKAAVNGAVAWIPLGPVHIQPAEFAKLAVILYLAYMFTQRQDEMRRPDFQVRELWGPLMIVAVCIVLVLSQPDTGGAIILTMIALIMLFASGISLRLGIGMSLLFGSLGGAAYYGLSQVKIPETVLKHSYQLRRLVAAFHPFDMVKTEGGQVVNSLLAIAHGGFWGVGLGMSSQKLGYLPEPYTDFILAVITEELGLLGASLVIIGIFFLIGRFYLIGIRAKNNYHALIAYGIATMMLIQTIFNVGAVSGVIPVTGVTLPFISYGGSSMLVLSISVGLMLNISASEKKAKEGTHA